MGEKAVESVDEVRKKAQDEFLKRCQKVYKLGDALEEAEYDMKSWMMGNLDILAGANLLRISVNWREVINLWREAEQKARGVKK